MGVEIGKPIPNYENYIIYPDGRVYSQCSKIFLKPHNCKTGYISITLYNKQGSKQFLVHRLVAMAFLPNPNKLPEVDPIDCNPSNNHMDNLRWISREENLKRSFDLKHQKNNKVKVRQLDLQGNLINEYDSEADAYRATHILHISEVVQHRRKTAGGYKWERSDDLSV